MSHQGVFVFPRLKFFFSRVCSPFIKLEKGPVAPSRVKTLVFYPPAHPRTHSITYRCLSLSPETTSAPSIPPLSVLVGRHDASSCLTTLARSLQSKCSSFSHSPTANPQHATQAVDGHATFLVRFQSNTSNTADTLPGARTGHPPP
jgi:hypothetical protein